MPGMWVEVQVCKYTTVGIPIVEMDMKTEMTRAALSAFALIRKNLGNGLLPRTATYRDDYPFASTQAKLPLHASLCG